MNEKFVPEIKGVFRNHLIEIPKVIRNASGIRVFGKRIKSFIFSTDVAVIKNTNADAIMAVYPFTPQPVITAALVLAADVPVFCGVGGSITVGKRVVNLALDAEFKGAMGVVVNSSAKDDIIIQMKETIDIPVVVTVVSEKEDIEGRINAGASILNVSAGKDTAYVVKKIRDKYPKIPIIATGGNDEKSIEETINAGANAITYVPPSTSSIVKQIMTNHRKRFD